MTATVIPTSHSFSSWTVYCPHSNTSFGRYESTGWLEAPWRFSTTAWRSPSRPMVAITRTMAAAFRSARRTSAWNASDTSPAATTATPTAGHVDHSRSPARSTKAR